MALSGKSSKPTWTRYKVLLWLGGAATIAYICRNSLSVAEKESARISAWTHFTWGW